MADILKAVLIDHDRNEIRIDFQRRDKGIGELFNNPAFLFCSPAFAHFENNNGHDVTCIQKYRANGYLATLPDCKGLRITRLRSGIKLHTKAFIMAEHARRYADVKTNEHEKRAELLLYMLNSAVRREWSLGTFLIF